MLRVLTCNHAMVVANDASVHHMWTYVLSRINVKSAFTIKRKITTRLTISHSTWANQQRNCAVRAVTLLNIGINALKLSHLGDTTSDITERDEKNNSRPLLRAVAGYDGLWWHMARSALHDHFQPTAWRGVIGVHEVANGVFMVRLSCRN